MWLGRNFADLIGYFVQDDEQMRLRRRDFLTGLSGTGIALALPACANAPERSLIPPPKPAQSADAIVSRAGLGGDIAYALIDMSDGDLLEARGANTGLPPASVAKAITALYALEKLGPGYRFTTRLLATGPVQDGVLRGDLVLAGGGDPTLDTDALAGLAARLVQGGVRRVEGRFLVWGGALPAIEQIANDQAPQAGYNPSVGGLNLNFNRVHFEWTRQSGDYRVTMDARSDRFRPEVRLARMQVANRASPLYTFQMARGVEQWSVARGALGNSGSRWLPVRQPDLYAGEAFQGLAAAQGLSLPMPQRPSSAPQGQTLAEHRSDTLAELLRATLRYSTNLSAEAIGLTATVASGTMPRNLAQSGAAMNAWARARYGMSSIALVDHSGLGAASRVSMSDLANMFRRAGREGALKPLLREHPFRDSNGRRLPEQPFEVRAKTGTLYFVSALGGYIRSPGGREMAFAICSSDLRQRARVVGAGEDAPSGTVEWARTARNMQQDLLYRWARAYS
jgi:D-alanyl-D-alanine carboxypeptidase/D-alanyl-D-alanine-endopeptidase (penicillin-binding protein 4)